MSDTTTHLSEHPHAFIDENNTVINVLVFKEKDHDSDLLEVFRKSLNATQVVCCCAFGFAGKNWTWDGTNFKPIQPYPSWLWNSNDKKWEAPTPIPTDGPLYMWDETTVSWQAQSA
jgi:hypothetical protein